MRMTEADALTDRTRQQLLLMAWFSPAFPIGGFAFSHGLEWAHERGSVEGRAGLQGWLNDLIELGSGRTDAVLLAAAYRMRGDETGLQDIIDLGAALQPSRERHLEASVQGAAFLNLVQTAYPGVAVTPAAAGPTGPPGGIVRQAHYKSVEMDHITLPVAVGLCGAAHGIALGDLIAAYLAGFASNLVSAAVRLGIVGQTDGQRVLAALHPAIARVASEAELSTLDDLGSATLRSDLFSLQHETQYSRLFRS